MNSRIEPDAAEVMRDEMIMKDRILALLSESPKTVPEVAESLESSVHSTLVWIMAMWRYGSVEETGKPDSEGYYHYQPTG